MMKMSKDIYNSSLPHRAVSVYMYLADRSGRKGMCFPAMRTIAKELGMSRRTVIRAVKDLEENGYISTEQRWRENGGRSTLVYTILM